MLIILDYSALLSGVFSQLNLDFLKCLPDSAASGLDFCCYSCNLDLLNPATNSALEFMLVSYLFEALLSINLASRFFLLPLSVLATSKVGFRTLTLVAAVVLL
jgi:hypothetical protein